MKTIQKILGIILCSMFPIVMWEQTLTKTPNLNAVVSAIIVAIAGLLYLFLCKHYDEGKRVFN